MYIFSFFSDKKFLLAFLIAILLVSLYAIYTDHRWEDWYITYRASKNLAEGHGLTFTPGERVYSFTSPINTLLPAFFAWLFPSNPDEYAIWLYRTVNILVVGCCSVLVLKISRILQFKRTATLVFLGLFLFNILIIDNSINGMETPYMMLFLLLFLYNLFKDADSTQAVFSFSFAGLLYTRPDGWLYASTILMGYLIFGNLLSQGKKNRAVWARVAKGLAIGSVLYLPWILFTWYYYGSPIPHTIIAKGNLRDYSLLYLLESFLKFPVHILQGKTCSSVLFIPAYAGFGGWYHLHFLGRIVGTAGMFVFLIPHFSGKARAISFSAFLTTYYLTYVSGQGGQPWYLPNLAVQVILIFCCLLNEIKWKTSRIPALLGYGFLIFNVAIFCFGAYEFRMQQRIVEWGNRKVIGEWLKAHAKSPSSTVFMECLGYIGYFSQLKTYDYPGMSSPEVVEALQEINKTQAPNYGLLIEKLQPEWLVLRPFEVRNIRRDTPGVLEKSYTLEKVFNVRENIPSDWYLMGKGYLNGDAMFFVFSKKP